MGGRLCRVLLAISLGACGKGSGAEKVDVDDVVRRLTAERDGLAAAKKQLQVMRRDLLGKRVTELGKPAEADVASFLAHVQSAAGDAGVRIKRWERKPAVRRPQGIVQTPVHFDVSGSLAALVQMFHALGPAWERPPSRSTAPRRRPVVVDGVVLRRAKGAIAARIRASLFHLGSDKSAAARPLPRFSIVSRSARSDLSSRIATDPFGHAGPPALTPPPAPVLGKVCSGSAAGDSAGAGEAAVAPPLPSRTVVPEAAREDERVRALVAEREQLRAALRDYRKLRESYARTRERSAAFDSVRRAWVSWAWLLRELSVVAAPEGVRIDLMSVQCGKLELHASGMTNQDTTTLAKRLERSQHFTNVTIDSGKTYAGSKGFRVRLRAAAVF